MWISTYNYWKQNSRIGGFRYFCRTISYRTRGKYQSLNPTSLQVVHFSKLEKLRYKIQNNFETDDIVFVFFFQNNFNRISIDVTFALEAYGPHPSPE